MKKVAVCGSVAFDQIMGMDGRFGDYIMPDKIHMLNVSFVANRMRREFGGTGGNIAYTLALLGRRPLLVSGAGNDWSDYKKHLIRHGVVVDAVVEDQKQPTAVGNVIADKENNQVWSFYTGPLDQVKGVRLGKMGVGFVVVAPTVKVAFEDHLDEVVKEKLPFMFDPAFYIPTFSKKILSLGVKKAEIVIGNDYEIELMARRLEKSLDKLMNKDQVLVTTLGAKGCVVRQGKQKYEVKAVKVKKAVDPTGAGDAFRAGFLAGFLAGESLERCGQMGAVAGAYAVEVYGTQRHKFTKKQFEKRLKENFG